MLNNFNAKKQVYLVLLLKTIGNNLYRKIIVIMKPRAAKAALKKAKVKSVCIFELT